MTKLSEFDQSMHSSKIRYVEELWDYHRNMRFSALNRVTGYLFILNSGALLASLTYVATKDAHGCIKVSIWLFAVGTLTSLLHAGLDYYVTDFGFSSYIKRVQALYEDKLDWEVFNNGNNFGNKVTEVILHMLGWTGAILLITGVVIGVQQIPSLP